MSTEYASGFALNSYHYSHNIVSSLDMKTEYLPMFLEVHQIFTATIPFGGYLYTITHAIPSF